MVRVDTEYFQKKLITSEARCFAVPTSSLYFYVVINDIGYMVSLNQYIRVSRLPDFPPSGLKRFLDHPHYYEEIPKERIILEFIKYRLK